MTSPFSSSPQTQMVEQDVARFIAQHFVQRLPRQRLIERRVEELLDPRGVQVLRCAVPRVAHGPDAVLASRRGAGGCLPHGDFARDGAALRRRAVARERCVPLSRRRAKRPRHTRNRAARLARHADLAATLPSGAISESSPSSACSAAKTTRRGAPFHGASGGARTASPAASSQAADDPWPARPR